jgi:hypothetical protein
MAPRFSVAPARASQGQRTYEVEGVRLELSRRGRAWRYDRPGLARPFLFDTVDDPPIVFEARVKAEEAVARLATPLLVPPRRSLHLWLAWPLEVAVLSGESEIDAFHPRMRRTLFGPVGEGVVLAAAVCEPVSSPGEGALQGRPLAALELSIESRADHAVLVPRVPVEGRLLNLFQRQGSLAAGQVSLFLLGATRAQAETRPGPAPPGFSLAVAAPLPAGGVVPIHGLSWLLDQTRHSAEFPL